MAINPEIELNEIQDRSVAQETLEPHALTPRQRLTEWWRQFEIDVFGEDARIQPLAGWLLSALFLLVAYLTVEYAPGAFERGQKPHGTDPEGVISVETGYWTIFIVALLAFVAGIEPYLTRSYDHWVRSRARLWIGHQPNALRYLITFLIGAIRVLYRLPSTVWSFLDYLLARPLATVAGATQRGIYRRYVWGVLILLTSVAVGILASPPLGLYGILGGLVTVLAIVRRWNWVEADREVFLIERGMRPGAHRIGFAEDLRDEAMIAMIFLFILIPLGLRQIQLATCGAGVTHCAFTANGSILDWVGYFGAELAKSVPFLDWSEVFQVANNSPIKPKTTIGAQVVFAMRATLDLLLLAAIVQAVRIAGRLRNQETAFRANRLPILEPFAEKQELHIAGSQIHEALGLCPTEQNSIATLPEYDERRLRELVSDSNFELLARKAATAILARQYPTHETDEFFTECARAIPDPPMHSWVLRVASGLAPDHAEAHAADRDGLIALLANRWEEVPVRAAAARALGRMDQADATINLMLERLKDRGEHLAVRADAGVALAKLQPAIASVWLRDLAGSFKGTLTRDELVPAMATAYACMRLSDSQDAQDITAVVELFDDPHREHAFRAARIQARPAKTTEAEKAEVGEQFDQMVRIAPGEALFSPTFKMGSPEDKKAPDFDNQAFSSEIDQTQIVMKRPFALGRYPVTQEEYLGFCRATGRPPLENSDISRWPVMRVSWRDTLAYCAWLERITGEPYRLPTEAEWEYACRAGTTTRFSWGDDWHDAMARCNRSVPNEPVNVGSFHPNPWGLWDMHGNVWEWCADPWHEDHRGRPSDSSVWLEDGDFSRRVIRGGSFVNFPQFLRSAYRNRNFVDLAPNVNGFRIARTLRL